MFIGLRIVSWVVYWQIYCYTIVNSIFKKPVGFEGLMANKMRMLSQDSTIQEGFVTRIVHFYIFPYHRNPM